MLKIRFSKRKMVVREKGKVRVSEKGLDSGSKYVQGEERDAGATEKRGKCRGKLLVQFQSVCAR